MYTFTNDYNQTMHPKLLDAFLACQNKVYSGYGHDELSKEARKAIQAKLGREAHIHFFSGGTITNLTTISHFLRPYEAVLSAESGHIFVHETGAIEATGHKVFPMRSDDGKITTSMMEEALALHVDEHMVKPKMLYISNTTELGTLYNKAELTELSKFCKEKGLYLFIDGARLASALAASDLTLKDYADLSDAFYIGGTKAGALMGEALIITNEKLNEDFRFSMKQKGAITAKSWIIASQFLAFFQNDLYEEIGKKLNENAKTLASYLQAYDFLVPPVSNQLFVIMKNALADEVLKSYDLATYPLNKEEKVLRFCTSFSTTKEDLEKFKNKFEEIQKNIN